jgi:GntR family transcriptional regulator
MLIEQHRRKVEDALLSAINSAKLAGMTGEELTQTLQTLLSLDLEE